MKPFALTLMLALGSCGSNHPTIPGACDVLVLDAGTRPEADGNGLLPVPFCRSVCRDRCVAACDEYYCEPSDAGADAVLCFRRCRPR